MKWDNEYKIKRLGREDELLFQNLIRVFQQVFETEERREASRAYLKSILEDPRFIVLVVTERDKVVGGLTAYELAMYYSENSEMYIYDIAIKPELQRKGLGKKLIAEVKEYCRKKGIKEFFVEAHEEDEHAIDFYRSVGGKAGRVMHFNYEVK